LDALTKHNVTKIQSFAKAKHLIEAALAFTDLEVAPALLYHLNKSAEISALHKFLEFLDTSLFDEGLLPLPERLAQEDLNNPVNEFTMNSIILNLY
jgi:hypothetical protein